MPVFKLEVQTSKASVPMSEDLKKQSKHKLDTLYPKRKSYGSYRADALEIPCERVQFTHKIHELLPLTLAFQAHYGRPCRAGYTISHRCKYPKDSRNGSKKKSKTDKNGVCITGAHLMEQLIGDNSKRNVKI